MPENNKTKEFLQKLAPCIERGDLDACVEEAVWAAEEMGIKVEKLMVLSTQAGMGGIHAFAYVLALAAERSLEGKAKAGAYCNAGVAAGFLGRKEQEEQHYKKAIAANPNIAEAHSNYANLLSELDRKTEAEGHYKQAIAANPNFAEAYSNYAILLKELDRKTEAEEHYKQAIAANPNFAKAYSNYAILLSELDRKTEAEEHYKQAIAANPNYAEAHSNYAILLSELNRKTEAEEHYKQAIAANPNYVEAHYNYAILLSELDRKTEAEERYKQAIAANPSLIEAHGAYGLFLIDSDKRDKAWEETKIASDMFQKAFRYTESYLAKAWFYQRYADKNLERNRYKESSKDINQAGEAYLKASETVEGEIKHALELKGEIKHALELKGNVCKAQSLIRKEHKSNQELVDDLKKASEFYKKASVCPAGGTEETCRACYSVMEVFSQVLMALEEVAHNKNPYLNKNEWNIKLEKSKKIYINIDSKKGVALILALKELIKCVDELAYYTTRKSSPQKKRLKDCYKTLEDVSSKVEGGLRNIIDPANEILRIYSKSKGIPMPEEKALYDSPSPFYEKLFKPIVVAIITIILGYITNLLFEWKTHATIWNFIKSTIINQTLP